MSDRRMIYPFTFTAKIVRFPFKFYYNNNPFFKYYIWSVFMCAPLFWKLQQLACSEANYIRYEEYRRKEKEEREKHKEHLL